VQAVCCDDSDSGAGDHSSYDSGHDSHASDHGSSSHSSGSSSHCTHDHGSSSHNSHSAAITAQVMMSSPIHMVLAVIPALNQMILKMPSTTMPLQIVSLSGVSPGPFWLLALPLWQELGGSLEAPQLPQLQLLFLFLHGGICFFFWCLQTSASMLRSRHTYNEM